MSKLIGTQTFGLRLPLIKEGDDLINAIINNYHEVGIQDGDIVGVTESVVARNAGMYVSLEEVGRWITKYKPSATVLVLFNPIFSRNRFVPILRGFLTAKNIEKVVVVSGGVDEVGNTIEHQITGVNYRKYYKELVEEAGKEFIWTEHWMDSCVRDDTLAINCLLHKRSNAYLNLSDILIDKSSWGLLGMNAAGNDRLKLFPDEKYANRFVDTLQQTIAKEYGKNVEVMVYGDGAFKDPMSGIWEWADPVVSPAWTSGLDGMPAEIKLKNAIDSGMSDGNIRVTIRANKFSKQQALGTTPRRVVDLLGSLMDLVSGSGDKGTPVVIVRDYFKKWID